jgi:hypothetical protein
MARSGYDQPVTESLPSNVATGITSEDGSPSTPNVCASSGHTEGAGRDQLAAGRTERSEGPGPNESSEGIQEADAARVIAHVAQWLAGEVFVSFDPRAIHLLRQPGASGRFV